MYMLLLFRFPSILVASFRVCALFMLFTFEFVFVRLRHFHRMFVRLLVPPLIFASFIRSISRVISSFSASLPRLECLPQLKRDQGNGTRSTAVERRFYNEGLYLGKRLRLPHCIEELPFSFTPCQVLHRWRGRMASATAGARSFKGVLCFIADRRYESNAFVEYFRSYEMKVERRSRPGNLSYLPAETYLSSRPINVPGPRHLFFPPQDIRPRFKIASSSSFFSSFLLPFPLPCSHSVPFFVSLAGPTC